MSLKTRVYFLILFIPTIVAAKTPCEYVLIDRSTLNPRTSHLSQLEKSLTEHLAFVETNLKAQTKELDIANREKLFHDLQAEARQRIASRTLTYRWWILYNFRLAKALTPAQKGRNRILTPDLTHEKYEELLVTQDDRETSRAYGVDMSYALEQWQKALLHPTTQTVDIFDLNLATLTGEWPAGLVAKPIPGDHGITRYPDSFYLHDISHFIQYLRQLEFMISQDPTFAKRWRDFQIKFFAHSTKQTPEIRFQLEFIYYVFTHEIYRFSFINGPAEIEKFRKYFAGPEPSPNGYFYGYSDPGYELGTILREYDVNLRGADRENWLTQAGHQFLDLVENLK